MSADYFFIKEVICLLKDQSIPFFDTFSISFIKGVYILIID